MKFNNVRIRLVVLNAAVLFLILAVLGSALFVHMRYRLYTETDEVLRTAAELVASHLDEQSIMRQDQPALEQDDRLTYIFRDAEGRIKAQSPANAFSEAQIDRIIYHQGISSYETIHIGENRYRAFLAPVPQAPWDEIESVTVLTSLEDDDSTLHSLLFDIITGVSSGLLISIIAGFFLAGRAWLPIRNAWDKQQQFVADASHELRTPVSIIRAQTELLLRHPNHSIERESDNIAVILKESRHMGKLLEDLLTLARSDSNQLELHCSLFSLDAMLLDLTKQFQLLAVIKEIEIHVTIQETMWLLGDESRIRQLFVILLDNALKYTPSNGIIEVAVRASLHHVSVSVSDTGIGIAKDELPYLFDSFYRGDKSRSRIDGGTGLGLSIAKWIVDAHGGTIRVESKPDTGTRFEIQLPRKNKASL
ncbi:sensor histidine kinase [Paenibacillus sp. PR3]|uniref:histidine kinase n=1 Tax=Paenibacillus terricola TaxID=2763503 RepID=A0ABR8MST1_9BACL|nr:ATP-binding protein [Paenibacillus terricola]MBD3919032.1 sensor histidine kinase [Paenibacillus terricola]